VLGKRGEQQYLDKTGVDVNIYFPEMKVITLT
jgi:hypothetical protein